MLNTIPLKSPDGEVIGLMGMVRDLRELEGLKRELEDRYSFANIIGTGPRMQEIFDLTERLSDTNTSVLIEGESGTGKELVARALHYHSPRKDKPFLKINCSALPDPLLESELFGYEKGAFTGATQRKPGKFKLADGGTLFLDEVGETSAAFQAKLLRVVQDLEFEPLGGTSVEKVNVRILAATNKDLKAEAEAGRFREDLYYRLCVVPVHLPPLRERKEDIPLLIDHALEKVMKKYPTRSGKKPVFSPQALAVFMDYDWPGNIRELENAVERSVVCSAGEMIDASILPREVRNQALQPAPRQEAVAREEPIDPGLAVRIRETLSQCKGNKSLAAKTLGMSRTTLWRRLREIEKSSLPTA
jgi:transcriptional regulator with PAS, ATPase and Fis domain